MNATLRLFRKMPQAHYPMTEEVLKRQFEFLRRGLRFGRADALPSLTC